MRSAGRPADPTVHPRTRPEAEENAMKMRGTGDWFRHDGKNVEEPTVPPARLQGYQAPEIAEKNSNETETWYEHDPKNPATPKGKPVPRCSTQEAKECKDKIYGKEEAWYKMEENKDYHTPRPKSRVTSVQGQECLEKLGKADTMNWYRHDHKTGDDYTPPPAKSRTGPLPYAGENKEKLNPQGAQPDWYSTDKQQNGEAQLAKQPASRVNTSDAKEYLDRNRGGSASDWYGHDSKVSQVSESPRVSKMGQESESWFSHDGKSGSPEKPKSHVMTESARNMVEKSRGNEMQNILSGQGQDGNDGSPARVKPEGQEIARKSMQGIMDKYMNQEGNANYNSARPAGRVVKPEAQEIAEKNKGIMADTFQGHPMGGHKDYTHARAVKPEAAEYAARNKGTLGNIMGGGGEASARPNPRLKQEASSNASKHQGQGMSEVLGGVGSMQVSGQQAGPRVQSASARAAAERNRGTMSDILKMQ